MPKSAPAKKHHSMKHCNCSHPKGFSCKASCKAQGKTRRTGGVYKGMKVKSKKYGGPA